MAAAAVFFTAACGGKDEFKIESATVADIGGVPRVVVNGKPERARMLYVSPTYFTAAPPVIKPLGTKWRKISLDIDPQKKEVSDGRFQIKTENKPMEYYLSKFEIVEKESGKQVFALKFDGKQVDPRIGFWCVGKGRVKQLPFEMKNTQIDGAKNGALRVAITKETGLLNQIHIYVKDIKFEAGKAYKINFRIKTSQDFAPLKYLYTMFDKNEGQYRSLAPKPVSCVEPQVRLARKAGVDIVTFPVQAADYYVKDGETPDYSYLDGALKSIVENNPKAQILVRIRFYPPIKWLRENPDSTLTFFDGSKSTLHASISSPKFRADSQRALRYIIDYAEKNFGDNIVGYHPGGGNSCEWFYGDSWSSRWQGYDKSTAQAWVRWLGKKYGSDQALQKAWNNPNAKIAAEKVPTKDERDAPNYLVNPKTQKRIADFNEFWQDEMLDMIDSLATVIRQKVPHKLCVFFYGYAGEFSGMYNGVAYSGHVGLGKLLKNGKIDALCGPISYSDRYYGDGKSTMGATESITRAGKLWIDEDDTSTYLAPKIGNYPGMETGLDTREKTLDVLTRNMSQEAVRNIGSWWMDLGGGGFFNDSKLWKLKTAFEKAENDMIENPVVYDPEIALIFDETSALYCAARGTSRTMVNEFGKARGKLNRIGAPFAHYLLDDILFGKPTNSKLDIYAVAYALDVDKRAAIAKRMKKNASIFLWAPAYIDIDKGEFSTDAVEELTGFKVENIQNGQILGVVESTDAGKKIGLPEKFGIPENKRYPDPLFSPKVESGDILLANYPNGKPAVVLRGKTLFCPTAGVPYQLYAHMAKIAGVKIYTDSPAAVYANGAYVSITPTELQDGQIRKLNIDTHSDSDVFDALTGEKLGEHGKVSIEAKRGRSLLLRLGNGNSDFKK